MDSWQKELRTKASQGIKIFLIGNKADLEYERMVSTDDGKKLAETMKCKYFEASAKTGQNVVEALDEIARITFNDSANNQREESIVLDKERKKNEKKCC